MKNGVCLTRVTSINHIQSSLFCCISFSSVVGSLLLLSLSLASAVSLCLRLMLIVVCVYFLRWMASLIAQMVSPLESGLRVWEDPSFIKWRKRDPHVTLHCHESVGGTLFFYSTCHSCCLCKYQLFGHFWYLTLYLLYYFGFSLNFLFRLILGFLQVGHFSNCDWYECFVSNLISWSSDPFFWLSLNFGSRIDDLLLFLDFSFLCYFFLCVIGSSIK